MSLRNVSKQLALALESPAETSRNRSKRKISAASFGWPDSSNASRPCGSRVWRAPALEHLGKSIVRHRLAEVVVHPRGQAPFSISLHGVGRHGDHGEMAPVGLLGAANLGRGDITVHLGHLNIHQDQVVSQIRASMARASRPLKTASAWHPSRSSIRSATFWLVALSSATSTRAAPW